MKQFNKIDLLGQKFGRWTVIEEAPPYRDKKGRPQTRWFCRCDCGTEQFVMRGHLRNGWSQSCGCKQREEVSERAKITSLKHNHCSGGRTTRIYYIWGAMIQRCTNPKNKRYKDWGGRGVKVCERWLKFENFYNDMGDRPEGLTLDRIDNDGNYEPGNCRWATYKVQRHNQRIPVRECVNA